MMKDATKTILPDKTHTYVFVPVKTTVPVTLRIIQVDNFEIIYAQLFIELCKRFCNSFVGPQLIASSKRMAGIKADAHAVF